MTTDTGSVLKKLFIVGGPIMLTNFLQTLYNITDTYFLGRLGPDQVASPSVSFNIIFLFLLFSAGFSNAGRTLISQSKGLGDVDKQNFYLGQITSMLIGGAFLLMPIIQLLIPTIFRLMAVPTGIFEDTVLYLRTIMNGLPFMFLSFALMAALQAVGDSFTPFLVNFISVALNILLDWLLIFGVGPFAQLGVQGAALATLIARGVNAGLLLSTLTFRKTGFRLLLRNLVPHWPSMGRIARLGLPMSLGQSASALGFTVLQGIVNGYGTAVIAAFNVGNRVINLFMMPAMGFSQAAAVLIGQNLGAGNRKGAFKALKTASASAFLFISVSMVITFFFGNHVTGFFVPDPEVIAWGEQLFRLVSPSVVFFSMFMVFNGAFQGSGDTKPVMFLNIFRLWILRVPIAYVLCILLDFGPQGIWIGMIVSNTLSALTALLLLIKRRWYAKLDPKNI